MGSNTGREVGHPKHKEWLAKELVRAKKRQAAKIAAGEIPPIGPRGRPVKERCICLSCGNEHIKGSKRTHEVLNSDWQMKWYARKKKSIQIKED